MSHLSKNNTILGLDIGTHSVKAIIAAKSKDGDLELLGASCKEQEPGAMRSGAIINAPSVEKTCDDAIREAEDKAEATACRVVVGIAGELIKSQTSRIHYTRSDGDKRFSDIEMFNITTKVESTAIEKAKKEIAFEMDNPIAEAELINSELISASIDGQKVDNLVGETGEDVIIEYYTAVAPSTYVRAIKKACKDLKLDLVSISVDPYAICQAILSEQDEKESFILMDIGGGNTNLAIVEDGSVRGTEAFGIGAKSIEKDLSIWFSGLKIALEDFPRADVLPAKIILCGGGAENAELQEALALTNWFKDLPFEQRPVIEMLDSSAISVIDKELNLSFATALSLARLGLK